MADRARAASATTDAPSIAVRTLIARYANVVALNDLSVRCAGGTVTAVIGPSGCGKSTLLRCINRLHESVPAATVTGSVRIGADEMYAPRVDVIALRRRVGMVFQQPTPFPTRSVFDNVAAGVRAAGHPADLVSTMVEHALRRAGLFDEVRAQLHGSPLALSDGQQQRLCIARALAVNPDVLLLDEPTASLDAVATQRIEELLYQLRESVTIVLVTHNLQQAARVADSTIFLLNGRLVEQAPSSVLFTTPADARTEAYVTGRFG